MTSLLTAPARARTDLRDRRPLALVTLLAGACAALFPMLGCMGLAVVGWFLSDAGAHGEPRDALRVGALGWLLGHRSGVQIDQVAVTVVPLLVTLVCAWTVWRVGLRAGAAISGHGPDADAIADGVRDWTVPVATMIFTATYVVLAAVTSSVAGTGATAPDTGRVVAWSLLLCVAVGGAAIATGSGRAAIWATAVPLALRGSSAVCAAVLRTWLGVCAGVLVLAVLVDLGTAENIMSQLDLDAGDGTAYLLASATVLPNALVFAGSYLLGPGFTVGVGTLVAPSGVSIGALPLFPLLAALPDNGPAPGWVSVVMVLPPAAAVVATLRTHRHRPTARWDEGIVRGLVGGVLAGLVFGILAALAGGAVGPGRMADVAPFAGDVLVHAVTAFGLGGLVGGVLATGLTRRSRRR